MVRSKRVYGAGKPNGRKRKGEKYLAANKQRSSIHRFSRGMIAPGDTGENGENQTETEKGRGGGEKEGETQRDERKRGRKITRIRKRD